MRVTNQLIYGNANYQYGKSSNNMYKANQDVSSGMKIQESYQDSGVFIDTMRLDYEITTLGQVADTSKKANTFAQNSDTTLNGFSDTLRQMYTKLVKASSSGTNSPTSMQAIAKELTALKNTLLTASNTSINGQFLFSGTAIQQKPMDSEGNYYGNDQDMKTVVGAGVNMTYNISGASLFRGYDGDYEKVLKTNVQLFDQTNTDKKTYITDTSTMKELVGDYAGDTVFYLQGRKPNGETFNSRFSLSPKNTMSELLTKIGEEYGNTTDNKIVDVSMNKSGQITIKDLKKGSNTIDFHLVGATDKTATAGNSGAAEVNSNVSNLNSNTDIKITSFIEGGRTNIAGSDAKASNYDHIQFEKKDSKITGTVSQVVKSTEHFATNETKLSEVAGGDLAGQSFTLEGKDVRGNAYNVTINLDATNSTFAIGGTTYSIFDAEGNQTSANDMTYRQLNDVISMVTSSRMPASNTSADYDSAIEASRNMVEVNMDYRGRIEIKDRMYSNSQITTSLYNANSGQFGTSQTSGSMLSFSANNALIIDEPYVDMFKNINNMIYAVKNQIFEADSTSKDPRNVGVESAIKRIRHISDHVAKEHTKIGTVSNALSDSNERAELLKVNVKMIQSDVIDADYGEAYLKLQQAQITLQAVLQSTAQINKLTLLNYM